MVRELREDEIQGAADMAPMFFEEGKVVGEFKPEVFVRSWLSLIKANQGRMYGLFIDSIPVGYLGLILTQDLNDGAKVAQEAFWYVHPLHRGHGLRLLLHAEKVAKELSCKRMGMVHLINEPGDQLSRIYKRMGFKPAELFYVKEL